MSLQLQGVLRWAGVLFGVVALFFAYSYLSTGFSADGTTGDTLKGVAWVLLALVVFLRTSGMGRSNR